MDRMISAGSKGARLAKRRAKRGPQVGDPGRDRLPPEASITLAAEREATGTT
jgi:hypothetical protein